MTNEKKKYLTPEMTVMEIKKADIIATSNPNEPLQNGDPIFG